MYRSLAQKYHITRCDPLFCVLNSLGDKQDYFSCWARSLVERRGYWRAVVAIAAKNARVAWAVLHYGEAFRLNKADA